MNADLVLEDTPDGLQVFYGGRRLYGRSPRGDAVRRIRSRTIQTHSLVLWPSPLLWYGWRELLDQLDRNDAVIAVEADPLLRDLAQEHFPVEAAQRILLVDADPAHVLRAHRSLGQRRFRRVVDITTTGSALQHRKHYRALLELLEREIRVFWQNRLTLAAFGRLWLRNLIDNIPELATGVGMNLPNGPGIVCGAGPSLERAIPLLKQHRSAATVIAVDTALPVLDAHGIRPDLVVALEGQLANLYDVLPVRRRDYCLAADISSNPTTARVHTARAWTLTSFAPVTLLDRVATLPGVELTLPPLGSVGVSAVDIALRVGLSPLFCTGLDFAVAPGVTHARGAPAYREELIRSSRLRPVRDRGLGARLVEIAGPSGPVSTTYVLKGYADELGHIVRARNDVFAVEPFGPDFGGRRISAEDTAAGFSAVRGPERAKVICSRPTETEQRRRAAVLADFVREEISRLHELDTRGSDGVRLPASCDYLACEIPDRIETLGDAVRVTGLDESAQARLLIARDHYLSRWGGALRRLERSTTPRRT